MNIASKTSTNISVIFIILLGLSVTLAQLLTWSESHDSFPVDKIIISLIGAALFFLGVYISRKLSARILLLRVAMGALSAFSLAFILFILWILRLGPNDGAVGVESVLPMAPAVLCVALFAWLMVDNKKLEKLNINSRSSQIGLLAFSVGIITFLSVVTLLLDNQPLYVHPLLDPAYIESSLSVLIDSVVLMSLCALLLFTKWFWARIVFLAISPWYLMAAVVYLVNSFMSLGFFQWLDALAALVGVSFVALVFLVALECLSGFAKIHVKSRVTLRMACRVWRIATIAILTATGAHLSWLYLDGYVQATFTGGLAEYVNYGPPAVLTIIPGALLALAAIGLLVNRRWSLVSAGVILFTFLLLYLFIAFALMAFGNAMAPQGVGDQFIGTILLPLVGVYILANTFMAFWCAKISCSSLDITN